MTWPWGQEPGTDAARPLPNWINRWLPKKKEESAFTRTYSLDTTIYGILQVEWEDEWRS